MTATKEHRATVAGINARGHWYCACGRKVHALRQAVPNPIISTDPATINANWIVSHTSGQHDIRNDQ